MNPNTQLVVLPKVLFGSPAYMFLRRDMNVYIDRRNNLRFSYKTNREEYMLLSAMIRNMANLVYMPPYKPKPAIVEDYVPEQRNRSRPLKKAKKQKPTLPSLFDN